MESQKTLQQLFDKPEHSLFSRFILSLLVEFDHSVGEEYDKKLEMIMAKLKDQEFKDLLFSGKIFMRNLVIKSEI